MRSELGKMSLDKVFRERESLNISIVESINKASAAWGITCLRYEIRDIKVSLVQWSMIIYNYKVDMMWIHLICAFFADYFAE